MVEGVHHDEDANPYADAGWRGERAIEPPQDTGGKEGKAASEESRGRGDRPVDSGLLHEPSDHREVL